MSECRSPVLVGLTVRGVCPRFPSLLKLCGGSGATNEAIGVWDERRGKCGGLALGLEALDGIVHAVQLLERESIQLP